MSVGVSTFDTVFWSGRFYERLRVRNVVERIGRKAIKIHLCNSVRAKDANVAQALRDKYGEKGTLKNPGPLFGIATHTWAALAVADYILTCK